MGNQLVLGQQLVAASSVGTGSENSEITFGDDSALWWTEEELNAKTEMEDQYLTDEPDYDMLSSDFPDFSLETFDELSLGTQIHVKSEILNVEEFVKIKSDENEGGAGEKDQNLYVNGVIVDIDETKLVQKYVIILENGTLIWASKDDIKLGNSEVNSPQHLSYRCSILGNIVNYLKKETDGSDESNGKKSKKKNRKHGASKKSNSNEDKGLNLGPYSKKFSKILAKCFHTLTNYDESGKKKKTKKNLQHSFSPKQKHQHHYFPPPAAIPTRAFSVDEALKSRAASPKSPLTDGFCTPGRTTDDLPWHNCFESRSQRNAKKPARKLRHSAPKPQNHLSPESPTSHLSSSFFDLNCSTTISFYDDSKYDTDDELSSESSLILPPSFISPRSAGAKTFTFASENKV